MLIKDSQIPEIYDLRHRFDNNKNKHFDYENNLLTKNVSNALIRNENMSTYLKKIEKIMVLLYESIAVSRNFFNISVHKYYNGHRD